MIYDQAPAKDIPTFLAHSPHVYYLTGSRYFRTDTEKSDWDYFVTDSPTVRDELAENGFVLVEPDPDNPNAYIGCDLVYVYKRENYHIQCVRSGRLKSRVQRKMRKFLWTMKGLVFRKSEMKDFWKLCYNLYLDGMAGYQFKDHPDVLNNEVP